MVYGETRTPGRWAAIATIVLSFLGAALGCVLVGIVVFGADSPQVSDGEKPILAFIAVMTLLWVVPLAVGAVLLVKHRMTGRYCVIAGAAIALVIAFIPLDSTDSVSIQELSGPALILVCALLPGTKAWCTE